MTYLSVATAINLPGRRDGNYFCKEMYRYEISVSKLVPGAQHVTAENEERRAPKRRAAMREVIHSTGAHLETMAIFGHGNWRAIKAGGFNIWNVHSLAATIARRTTNIRIILYACSCGAGRLKYKKPNQVLPSALTREVSGWAGFAMRLAGALQELDVRFVIYAHTNKGRACMNPHVVRVRPQGTDQASGIVREEVVPFVSWWKRKKNPTGRARWLAWKKHLSTNPTFRFRFPFMKQEDIDLTVSTLAEAQV